MDSELTQTFNENILFQLTQRMKKIIKIKKTKQTKANDSDYNRSNLHIFISKWSEEKKRNGVVEKVIEESVWSGLWLYAEKEE